jgi:hypothetical protein
VGLRLTVGLHSFGKKKKEQKKERKKFLFGIQLGTDWSTSSEELHFAGSSVMKIRDDEPDLKKMKSAPPD